MVRTFVRHLVLVGILLFPILETQSLPEDLGMGRFSAALFTLGGVPGGATLLKKAVQIWELEDLSDLLKRFKWGKSSRTDTVLTRTFNPLTGVEKQDRDIVVFLRENQSQLELILDMAHELVHATARAGFDPYDLNLTPGKYIRAAIEGEGGEVQAVLTECEVGLELGKKWGVQVERCEPYRSKLGKGELLRQKILEDFYRVGKWQFELHHLLGSEIQLFPYLSKQTPKLYSSTGHTPYPVALFHEFQEMTEVACKNSLYRMENSTSQNSDQNHLQQFIFKRCK